MKQFEQPITLTSNAGVELLLRLMSADDINSVMELEASAHSHPWRRKSFEDCIGGRQKCWLAEANGKLVGYIVIAHGGGDAEILNVAVSPKKQGKGIGSLLVQHAIDCVRGFADMLFLEVRVSNHKAIALYSKEGFFEVGLRKNYYPTLNGNEDALLMASQL